MKTLITTFLLFLCITGVWAQRTCGTVAYNEMLKNAYPVGSNQNNFENWMSEKKLLLHSTQATQSTMEATTIFTIPVVVHIIHNGEAEGVGTNITLEQILSQFVVLNEDFRHLNVDSINTPVIFQPLMADIGFEFVLASQDPTGFPTNGITRTKGTRFSWSMSNNAELKALSYWPSEDYFNLWVAPISGSLIGWAEFPTTPLLNGLEDALDNPLTDGIVIDTDVFGTSALYPSGNYLTSFDLGRTATHEAGHFFGLRHVSGDGGCGVDDYVTDTPEISSQHQNCPSPGSTLASCSVPPEPVMYMNYMDFVDDNCMNLFSTGQKDRMLIVINNSPRRASLLTSHALLPPATIDAAITTINSPGIGLCTNQVTPNITIQNVGTLPVTNIDLTFFTNGVSSVQQVFPVNIASQQDTTLAMNTFTLTAVGTINFEIRINEINGVADTITFNNSAFLTSIRPQEVTQLDESFENWPSSWSVRTAGPVSYWNVQQAPADSVNNFAAVLAYYNNPTSFNDELVTPVLDLSTNNSPVITFDLAYSYSQGFDDQLLVAVSSDCGNSFPDTVFVKAGQSLATASVPVDYTPSGPGEWRTEVLDLSQYSNNRIQLVFSGKSAGGNNIYIDKITLHNAPVSDLAIVGLANESGSFMGADSFGIRLVNRGTVSIQPAEIEIFENGELLKIAMTGSPLIAPSSETVIFIDNDLTIGTHQLELSLTNVDDDLSNNKISAVVHNYSSNKLIPFREKFDGPEIISTNNWQVSSPFDNITWIISSANSNNISAVFRAFSTGNKGLADWLIFPVLDFSNINEASLHFNIAYARNNNAEELLRLWTSADNGQSFDLMVDEWIGAEMSSTPSTVVWTPQSDSDWKPFYVNLDDFIGNQNVQFAFQLIDGDGNDVFIDDIEFFISDDEFPLDLNEDKIATYPNPVLNGISFITFNLDQLEEVTVLMHDLKGHLISTDKLTNVLNQTFPIEIRTQKSGIYVMSIMSKTLHQQSKIVLIR